MNSIILDNNQHTNTLESNFKDDFNNMADLNLSSTSTLINTGLSEDEFDSILKNIKVDNFPLVPDEYVSSDSDDFTEKLSQQENKMYLSSTPTTLISTGLSENEFETIIQHIKAEKFPLIPDESYELNDLDDSTERKIKLTEQENYIFKEPSTLNEYQNDNENISNKADLNVFKSNSQIPKKRNSHFTRLTKSKHGISHLYSHQKQVIGKTSLNTSRHNCSKYCVRCKKTFALLDNPKHIGCVRNLEKKNSLLKIRPTLNINSCLCDRCFKWLETTYKTNKTEKKEKINMSSNAIDINRRVDKVSVEKSVDEINISIKTKKRIKRNRICNVDICSVHGCSRYSIHQISIDECTQIKKIFSLFDISHIILIESKKKTKQLNCPLSVCDIHLPMINCIITCQLCYNNLDYNYLDPEDWKLYERWNLTLLYNDIPLRLQPGMFICSTCQGYISVDSFSTNDLEIMQRNVERRNDVRSQLFGSSSDNISEYFQFDNVFTPPIIVVNTCKSENTSKIKFTEPLITSTRYFTPNSNEYTYTSDSFSEEKFSTISNENLEYDIHTNYCILDPESQLEESEDSVITDSLICNSKENDNETLMSKKYENISSELIHNPRQFRNNDNMFKNEKLNQFVLNVENDQNRAMIPNLQSNQSLPLAKDLIINNENPVINNVLSLQPLCKVEYIEGDENMFLQNVDDTSTRYFTPNSNEYTFTSDSFSEEKFSTISNENLEYDVHTNYCILDPESQLEESKDSVITDSLICNSKENYNETLMRKKYENISSELINNPRQFRNNNNMFKNEKLNQFVLNVENDQNRAMIPNLQSNQSLPLAKDLIINNENPVINNVLSLQPLCKVEYLESDENMFLQKVDDIETYENNPVLSGLLPNQTGKVLLNRQVIDTNVYSDQSVHKVENEESDGEILVETDPVAIKTQLRNVVLCRNIEKKHGLKEIPDSQMVLESAVKKQRLNKTTLLYKSENKMNNSVTDSSNECYTNTDVCSSSTNKDFSSSDEEINFMKYGSIGKLNTTTPPIQIGSPYSLDSNCASPLRFHRTLKRVDDYYYTKILPSGFNKVMPSVDLSNQNIIEITSDNVQSTSNLKTEQDKSRHRYELFPQPHNLTKHNMNETLYSNNQEEGDAEDKKLHSLKFELNNRSDIQIYTQLLDIYKDESLVLKYLLENERMLYNRELIPSKTANEVTTKYLNEHLDLLGNIYGDPKHNKADVSYLLEAPASVRNFSKRSNNQNQGITSVPFSTSTPMAIISNNITHTNHISQVQNCPRITTYTKSKPIVPSQITSTPATRKRAITSESFVNNQFPLRFIKPKPNINQPTVQPSFQLPTAIGSKRMSFTQTNKSNVPLSPKPVFKHI